MSDKVRMMEIGLLTQHYTMLIILGWSGGEHKKKNEIRGKKISGRRGSGGNRRGLESHK